ncbi:uncharacterized protein ASCRUDRAFT_5946 [Ascoidea rubescens DSM 1968]|uniref:Uncharacterized protein n=1 Tax=Ascoidea rubescens DSM 1968 TaxID=1344418 RepID=A0A1D2VR29_9ASCO|nr:hypothetical protein ASCRUDRAFT_5946 [Ascoidea rubescens DSM 1968]ODV64066.1 hypothetical protein ASCRUDRAFT_5946 [Ascoidea rubescens DSM 1968]
MKNKSSFNYAALASLKSSIPTTVEVTAAPAAVKVGSQFTAINAKDDNSANISDDRSIDSSNEDDESIVICSNEEEKEGVNENGSSLKECLASTDDKLKDADSVTGGEFNWGKLAGGSTTAQPNAANAMCTVPLNHSIRQCLKKMSTSWLNIQWDMDLLAPLHSINVCHKSHNLFFVAVANSAKNVMGANQSTALNHNDDTTAIVSHYKSNKIPNEDDIFSSAQTIKTKMVIWRKSVHRDNDKDNTSAINSDDGSNNNCNDDDESIKVSSNSRVKQAVNDFELDPKKCVASIVDTDQVAETNDDDDSAMDILDETK